MPTSDGTKVPFFKVSVVVNYNPNISFIMGHFPEILNEFMNNFL